MLRLMKTKVKISNDGVSLVPPKGVDFDVKSSSSQADVIDIPRTVRLSMDRTTDDSGTDSFRSTHSSSLSSSEDHPPTPWNSSRISDDEGDSNTLYVAVSGKDSRGESCPIRTEKAMEAPHTDPLLPSHVSEGSITDAELEDCCPTTRPTKQRKVVVHEEAFSRTKQSPASHLTLPRLLALPDDPQHLPPLHVWVRRQIQVFGATHQDMAQPAPGRKHSIQLHQVGLRCIHCVERKERVKRAVCYPRNVARIYHSVSDMKFDHFGACQGLPEDLRAEFLALKRQAQCKKKTKSETTTTTTSNRTASTTAQYYHEAAVQLGLVEDTNGGIFLAQQQQQQVHHPLSTSNDNHKTTTTTITHANETKGTGPLLSIPLAAPLVAAPAPANPFVNGVTPPLMCPPFVLPLILPSQPPAAERRSSHVGSNESVVPLALPSDQDYLNPLHVFLRQQVQVFGATPQDVAAPAPGRKTRIQVGQVGIRCRHCANLPKKDRVKRAVCYPPSVSGIYHAVSNIKFDHFALCQGLSDELKEELERLQTAKRRRGTHHRSRTSHSSSTAQYYQDAAVQLGLVDTPGGIRFRESPPGALTVSGNSRAAVAHAGISALMIAATTHGKEIAHVSRSSPT